MTPTWPMLTPPGAGRKRPVGAWKAKRGPVATTSVGTPATLGGTSSARESCSFGSFASTEATTASSPVGFPSTRLYPTPAATTCGRARSSSRASASAERTSFIAAMALPLRSGGPPPSLPWRRVSPGRAAVSETFGGGPAARSLRAGPRHPNLRIPPRRKARDAGPCPALSGPHAEPGSRARLREDRIMAFAKQTSVWTRILVVGIALLAVFLSLGYGLIGLFILFLLVSMGGGALLYWLDGESDD